MQITKEKLIELDACSDGIDWFEKKGLTDLSRICGLLIQEKHFNWANWLLTKLMRRSERIKYAVFAAEQVIHVFEAKYPDDKRPRNAIETAKECLENLSKTDAAAAAAAYADAAAAAAADAAAAAYADAAAAAAAYADAAAAAYADAAARLGMQKRIIDFGLSLLTLRKDAD